VDMLLPVSCDAWKEAHVACSMRHMHAR
jgi:hypothetical protein